MHFEKKEYPMNTHGLDWAQACENYMVLIKGNIDN